MMGSQFVNHSDFIASSRATGTRIFASPLIEICSVSIRPHKPYKSCQIHGLISVVDSKGEIYELFNRNKGNTQTIDSAGPQTLLLTGPKLGAITMNGSGSVFMNINLDVLGLNSISLKRQPPDDRVHWFAHGCLHLDTATRHCYDELKSLIFEGDLGDVCVHYIVMPCAMIGAVRVIFTKKVKADDEEIEYDSDECDDDGDGDGDRHDSDISGSITACYNKTYGAEKYQIFLYKKPGKKRDPVAYGVPFKLCRSFVCVPIYSSLVLKFNMAMVNMDSRGKGQIVFRNSMEFKPNDCGTFPEYLSVGNFGVTVNVTWLNPDHPNLLSKKGITQSHRPLKLGYKLSPTLHLWGMKRIQVLSVFVGSEGEENVDLCGSITVSFTRGSNYIFKREENCPSKVVSLKGLTTYPHDHFMMNLKLKDVKGGHYVDIEECLYMYYQVYEFKIRPWYNRPLCTVHLGKRGFAAVHFIVFESAVKATVKISVIGKGSIASRPFVCGSLVAQYGSNYAYSTNYQRNYCRIKLFEELEEKEACRLTGDGEIPLCINQVAVPLDSYLIVDVDLRASVSRPKASGFKAFSAEHFLKKVEIKIGDARNQRIEGQSYEVVIATKWEDDS